MEKNDKARTSDFVIDALNELRIETRAKCTIQLKSGLAEIFGTELSKSKDYTFANGGTFAIFTWHGCTITMTGNLEDAYIAQETPMIYYLNIHAALQQMRQQADTEKSAGPRVMVLGPEDVGKSTLCRMLLNWAVRAGSLPVYVDLDVSQNSISLPGTISALPVEKNSLVDEGFSSEAQLVYHFGYKTPNENPNLYRKLITTLRDAISLRSEQILSTLTSGVIINTSGWIRDEGYKSILHTAMEFEVTVILVIDQERLRVDLRKDLPDYVKVLSVPKSGGVVSKPQDMRSQYKNMRMHEYFYGSKSQLFPYVLNLNDAKIFKIGAPHLPDSLLPMGMKPEDNFTRVFQITPTSALLNHLLSVSYADDREEESNKDFIAETNIAGYVVVTKVDAEKGTVTVLSPAKPLPKSILLASDIQFVDLK